MSENRAKKQNIWVKVGIEAAIYATVFLLAILAYWTVKPLIAVQSRGFVAQVIMGLAILLCLGFVAYMGATKRLTTRTIILVFMIIGLIMRLGYVLYTPATYRQHDTFSKNFDGHEAYAWTIFSTGKLPTTNKYQFYHPPLNALLQAGFMKFFVGFVEFVFPRRRLFHQVFLRKTRLRGRRTVFLIQYLPNFRGDVLGGDDGCHGENRGYVRFFG